MTSRISKILLIGNPNSGKSSLFNQLTGLNQKIGNFPGVTVDKKTGQTTLDENTSAEILDLPGIYSLYPRSLDEKIVVEVFADKNGPFYPDKVVLVADATNLKNCMLLLTQLIDLGLPTVLALNMIDLAAKSGLSIDVKKLSTLLDVPVILINARTGQIMYNNKDIARKSPDRVVKMGISQVPEGRQIFNPLTVLDNLKLGSYIRYRRDGSRKIQRDIEEMFTLFPILQERQNQLAGTLSGGEQQMLAIGRALMSRPRILLRDEPSMGLAPLVVTEIFKTVARLREMSKTTIFLVEQNARAALKLSDRGYVMETGKIMFEGNARDLLENREVQRAYLGKEKKPIWE